MDCKKVINFIDKIKDFNDFDIYEDSASSAYTAKVLIIIYNIWCKELCIKSIMDINTAVITPGILTCDFEKKQKRAVKIESIHNYYGLCEVISKINRKLFYFYTNSDVITYWKLYSFESLNEHHICMLEEFFGQEDTIENMFDMLEKFYSTDDPKEIYSFAKERVSSCSAEEKDMIVDEVLSTLYELYSNICSFVGSEDKSEFEKVSRIIEASIYENDSVEFVRYENIALGKYLNFADTHKEYIKSEFSQEDKCIHDCLKIMDNCYISNSRVDCFGSSTDINKYSKTFGCIVENFYEDFSYYAYEGNNFFYQYAIWAIDKMLFAAEEKFSIFKANGIVPLKKNNEFIYEEIEKED